MPIMLGQTSAASMPPNKVSNMVQLSSKFNNCCLETPTTDPDEWLIELEIICNKMTEIDPSYEKREHKITAHIICRLPEEYNQLIPVIEGNDLNLCQIKH
jgi:hypothetical protein